MKKQEQNIRYDSEGEKIVNQEIMNAYQSGVIGDDDTYSQMGDNPLSAHRPESRQENLMQDNELEEKSPDDFE
ncbi:hypothetical protein [Aneurinibacillus danicus]|jgi:hypothetical protein|uniref:Uncharacterized protein n=1 Tax=Aneurinibacillus danicus TaxID=267746 RepID=A0A511V4B0_9BACL|nr:hypothetical protein [Aneurinibacillus danicus]GEN33765.1 hypothetical protein ADA01nite_12250 [Aneurinibacillus danicus]